MDEEKRMAEAMSKIFGSIKTAEKITRMVLPAMMECDDMTMLFCIIGSIVDTYARVNNISDEEVENGYITTVAARRAILEEES